MYKHEKTGFLVIISLIVLVLWAASANADWGEWLEGGEAVCTASGNQAQNCIASDGGGGAIIAWTNYELASPRVYAQRIDADGDVVWMTNGVLVVDPPPGAYFDGCYNPQIIEDGAGGAIVVSIGVPDYSLIAQRIDANGNLPWGSGGVIVYMPNCMDDACTGFGIVADGAGGVTVGYAFVEAEVGQGYDMHLNVQRIDANGNFSWMAPTVVPDYDILGDPQITLLSDGGFAIVWCEDGLNTKIMAQKLTADGSTVWSPSVTVVTHPSVSIAPPQVASDGAGGAIVSWIESYELLAQRINSGGNAEWTSGGVLLSSVDDVSGHRTISDGMGGAIVTFSCNILGVNSLYLQHIDGAGAPQWSTEGIEVSTSLIGDNEFDMASDGQGGLVTSWRDSRNGNSIYAMRVDGDGNQRWTAGGLPICSVPGEQATPAVMARAGDGVVVSWKDGRGVDDDIYAQRIDNTYLKITDIEVNTAFNPATYTWDAEFTFETNLPAIPTVLYDPTMDCFPSCGYTLQQSGPEETNHTVTISNLPASTAYCYKITAYSDDDPLDCDPEVDGSFELTNSYQPIYDIAHSFNSSQCKIIVDWSTKYPSTNNKVYYRELGAISWQTVFPEQGEDCDEERYYVARIPVEETTTYQFKIYTTINGATFNSTTMTRSSTACGSKDPPFPLPSPEQMAPVDPFVTAVPNPFNPTTTITYSVPTAGDIDVSIYAADGSLVKRLVSGNKHKGLHSVVWDSTSETGDMVATGVYFVRFAVTNEVLTSKIVLLK